MANQITIRKAPGVWTVRAGGAVLGESSNALEVSETDHPVVIYFPRSDIATAFLDKSDKITHCPDKGEAKYYSVVTKSGVLENAVWTYEDPADTVERIKDHLAFQVGDTVTVEQI